MNFETWLSSRHPEIPTRAAAAVLELAATGATVPFIARYRKEATGGLDEVGVRVAIEAKESWDEIVKRQAFIEKEIEAQGKLTEELAKRIRTTFDLATLEDLYLPYKKKRKTKAVIAREAGLQPLADWLWDVGHGAVAPGETAESRASGFLNAEAGITDAPAALKGAVDILVERLSETEELRQFVRREAFEKGAIVSTKGEKAKPFSKFELYFDSREPVASLLKPESSHRYLAMRRGWMEGELTLSLGDAPKHPGLEDRLLARFSAAAGAQGGTPGATGAATQSTPAQPLLEKAARFALKAHVLISIETEIHAALKEVAETAAIHVFAENVRKVLLAAPFGPKAVLGLDPGLRTGCKLAVVDGAGKYVASTVVHLVGSEAQRQQAARTIVETARNAAIRAIAVGNGTGGREAEAFVREALAAASLDVPVVLVSEAGASVYSASETAREEFPDLDLTVRGAISIARRLQDPLAELVKVDPKSIGVGQYQHDVSPHALKTRLDQVVDSAVNQTGVSLNTASSHLLAHVSGIGPTLGRAIVAVREEKGVFRSRQELLKVPRFTKKTFEQAAGFLRIPDGENPLDNTGVHPERYDVLEAYAKEIGKDVRDLLGSGGVALVKKSAALRETLGAFTFEDVVKELEKPGRDPRDTFVPFSFREGINQLSDLEPGMICPGVVTNVTNFGAFIDIGVHQDGLAHISQLSTRYVKDPREVVNPGDRVQVKVLAVNLDRKQISLTLRLAEDAPPAEPRAPRTERPRSAPAPAPKPEPKTVDRRWAALEKLGR
ncbi:MAG: RNA-binding transcriptional accessory protein [Acidobacteria bacterium]|nr:RNA-binding transcriptional accessory protein [Acidobacteriota bacterium]